MSVVKVDIEFYSGADLSPEVTGAITSSASDHSEQKTSIRRLIGSESHVVHAIDLLEGPFADFSQLTQGIIHMSDPAGKALYGKDWSKSAEMTISWTISSDFVTARSPHGDIWAAEGAAMEGTKIAVRTDMDVEGFVKAFWPEGVKSSAVFLPTLNVIFWRAAAPPTVGRA